MVTLIVIARRISLLCSLDGIYRLRPFPAASSLFQNNEWILWHEQLGHLHNDRLLFLFRNECLNSYKLNKSMSSSPLHSKCTSCCLSKSHILPFVIDNSWIVAPFDIIHTYVWGIALTLSRLGYKYYVTFIDDYTCYAWIYFLR